MALRAGLRPAAARVPAGGTAAAAADRPAQPAGAAPAAVPGPGPHCRGQSRGARPRGSGRGERRRKGRCVGMCRWGRGRLRDLPLKCAQNPENLVAACELQGLGRFPDARARVPCPVSPSAHTCAALGQGGGGGDQGPPSVGLPPAEPAPPPLLRCQWYGPVANPWLPWQPPGVQPAPPPPAAGVARGRPLQRLPGRLGPAPATRGRRCIRPRSRYGRPSLGAGLRQPLSRGRGTPLQTPKLRGLAPLYLLSLGST